MGRETGHAYSQINIDSAVLTGQACEWKAIEIQVLCTQALQRL